MSKVSLASTVAGWECLCMLADRSHSYLCDVQIVLRESVRSRVQSSRYHISSGAVPALAIACAFSPGAEVRAVSNLLGGLRSCLLVRIMYPALSLFTEEHVYR